MTTDQRERLRLVIESGILVRRGEYIDEDVAEERARNLVTIIELMCSDFRDEVTLKGPPPRNPAGETAETLEMRMAEMEADANRIIR